jgi:hypothetical protein
MSYHRQAAKDGKMTRFEIPTVTTERLRLRAFRQSDLGTYSAMQGKPEVIRYMVLGHIRAGRGLAI